MQRVIIASKNPVKIHAMKEAFEEMLEGPFSFEGASAESGVSDQPFRSEETYRGALNRVKHVQATHPDAHYWVGIEGGIERIDDEIHCMASIVIASRDTMGTSKVASFVLPKCVSDLVEQGSELGDAAAQYFKEPNSKQRMGVVGILTDGAIDRTAYYSHPARLALVPFKNQTLYS